MSKLRTSIGALLVVTVIGLSVLTGCTASDSTDSSNGAATVEIDETELADQYAAEAESEITDENADTVLSDLEKEIADDDTGQ